MESLVPWTLNTAVVRYLYIISFTSVNVFGMVTGWLNCDKVYYKWNRLLDLLSATFFWCLSITAVSLVLLRGQLTFKDIIGSLCPPIIGRYWYIVSYVFVYFSMPYLNKLIQQMDKRAYEKFLLVQFILLSILPTIMHTDLFRINTGMSPFWLIICYFIGAYIKKYCSIKVRQASLAGSFYVIAILPLLWWMIVEKATLRLFGEAKFCNIWVDSYSSPFIVILAVIATIWGCNLEIDSNKLKAKIINLSDLTFGIYIIHCHVMILDVVIGPLVSQFAGSIVSQGAIECVPIILVGVLTIFLMSAFLEKLRTALFSLLKINNLLYWAEDRLNSILPLS